MTIPTMMRAAAALTAVLATIIPASADVIGRRPAYTDRTLSLVPNADAITTRIWAPDLDQGFVPQGLTFFAGAIYVGAYKSEDPRQGRGPCRLYRIDPRSGAIWGALDLPPSCGHAGGLARGTPGRLWVADTRAIFEIALDGLDSGSIGTVLRSVELTGDIKGSFAASTADALWLGTYSKETRARLYKLPFEKLRASNSVSEADADASIELPTKAQGAAFDPTGRLWITRSGSTFGELVELDAATGAERQRFAMPPGIEDISFEPGGAAWSVSEAGSKRWLAWPTFFPVIFRLEMNRLH